MKINTILSHFINVTNFRLVCLLPIVAYSYICGFVFDPLLVRIDMDVNEQERLFKIEI